MTLSVHSLEAAEGSGRGALLLASLRALPLAITCPPALRIVGSMFLGAVLPYTESNKKEFSNGLASEFGQLMASAWVSDVVRRFEQDEAMTPEIVRPSLDFGPSEAWQGIIDNVKGYGLAAKEIDEVLCAGLTQLTQNNADVRLPQLVNVPHATVQAALAKPLNLG